MLIISLPAALQAQQVKDLPGGAYQTLLMPGERNWDRGPLELGDAGIYRFNNDSGEFRFSVAGQRVFFTSGPLKGAFATTRMVRNAVVIIFPVTETQPFAHQMEVWARKIL